VRGEETLLLGEAIVKCCVFATTDAAAADDDDDDGDDDDILIARCVISTLVCSAEAIGVPGSASLSSASASSRSFWARRSSASKIRRCSCSARRRFSVEFDDKLPFC